MKMEMNSLRHNELITGISILAVLRYAGKMEVTKCMLIEPLLGYAKVLQLLKRSNSSIKSIEDLIIKESVVFSNFSTRFRESILLSTNAIFLFQEMGLIKQQANELAFCGERFCFECKGLGNTAIARIKASKKLAEVLSKGETSDIYLSLRIEV